MLDDIDRGLVHALSVDGRAPFARVAAVLGVSTQTVVRRYHRLRGEQGLRVVGLPDPDRPGTSRWLARLTTGPRTARDLAGALARRPDTSWVKPASGGTEIVAIVHAEIGGEQALLLHDVPHTTGITTVSAHQLLHTYRGGPTAWRGRLGTLTPTQEAELTPCFDAGPTGLQEPDAGLLEALALDGRTSLADLAARTGRSAATVARRIEALRASGALFLDVEMDDAAFGAGVQAMLWMSVVPSDLDATATAMAGHPETAFVASTTGRTNLVALTLCPDPGALHRYLTGPVAGLAGVRDLETAPMMATVKAAGPLRSSLPRRVSVSRTRQGLARRTTRA